MKVLLALLIVLGSVGDALIPGVRQRHVAMKLEIAKCSATPELVSSAGGTRRATGAMIYLSGSRCPRRYGWSAVAACRIVDHGNRTLVAGTIVGMLEIVADDPEQPARLRLERGRKVDVAALAARYAAFEHVGGPGDTRAAIEAAVAASAAKANKVCGTRIAPQIKWADFAKAGKVSLAKQAIAIYDAIETSCADKDYRGALQAITALRVEHGDSGLASATPAAGSR
jgi:hypothetical protein